MHESTLDLFTGVTNISDDILATEFANEIEAKAAALEVTVDYYMQEFM
tara:strand:+ start:809 stop:952 length:144 start_codon:yes stop_codon:yes gene_type:complete